MKRYNEKHDFFSICIFFDKNILRTVLGNLASSVLLYSRNFQQEAPCICLLLHRELHREQQTKEEGGRAQHNQHPVHQAQDVAAALLAEEPAKSPISERSQLVRAHPGARCCSTGPKAHTVSSATSLHSALWHTIYSGSTLKTKQE